jgi:hypothetical protein
MPRNRTHEIEQYLSDEYHSDGGEGYGSTTQAYSRAYGRLKRAERAAAKAAEAKAIIETNVITEANVVNATKAITEATAITEVKANNETKAITETNLLTEVTAA